MLEACEAWKCLYICMVSFRNEIAENQGKGIGQTWFQHWRRGLHILRLRRPWCHPKVRNLLRWPQRVESSVNCAKKAALEVRDDVVLVGANAVSVTFSCPSLQ